MAEDSEIKVSTSTGHSEGKKQRRLAVITLLLLTVFDLLLATETPRGSLLFPIVTVVLPATIAFLAAVVLTTSEEEWNSKTSKKESTSNRQADDEAKDPEDPDFDLSAAAPSDLKRRFRALQARYDLLTTNIAASVLIYDSDSKLVFCSPYTEVLTGYLLEEILADPNDFFTKLVVPEHQDRYERAKKISEIGEDMLVRYQIRHRTGLPMWLETRLVPLNSPTAQSSGIMAVTIDVTDSLNYQKQIEEQNRDLSDFAYMVSHDLKAPIFTIKGMADALTEDYSESLADDGRELVEYIVSATERLERLVESVIEYSSISTKELKEVEVDLNEALTSVTADLQELIRTNSATVDVQTNLGTVTGSPVRIYQVFSNLVGNAIKYRAPERDPHVTISAHSLASGGLKVDVTDNGLGIPTDKLDEVFRPYRRVHAGVAEGSGIGLACVKKIVDHLNGTVSVQSKEGVGSTFTVIFPGPPTAAQGIPKDLQRLYKDS